MSKKTGPQGKGRSKPRQKGDPQVQADPSTESVGSQERTGRPPKYKSEFAAQAQKLCLLGATDKDLAEFFEVTDRTINRWRIQHKDFCRSLKLAKDEADARVERSLYHKATGYTFDSEKVFQYEGQVVRAKTQEHVPPDTTAMIFWLKNRQPQLWRDRIEHTGKDGDPLPIPVIQIMPPSGDKNA